MSNTTTPAPQSAPTAAPCRVSPAAQLAALVGKQVTVTLHSPRAGEFHVCFSGQLGAAADDGPFSVCVLGRDESGREESAVCSFFAESVAEVGAYKDGRPKIIVSARPTTATEFLRIDSAALSRRVIAEYDGDYGMTVGLKEDAQSLLRKIEEAAK